MNATQYYQEKPLALFIAVVFFIFLLFFAFRIKQPTRQVGEIYSYSDKGAKAQGSSDGICRSDINNACDSNLFCVRNESTPWKCRNNWDCVIESNLRAIMEPTTIEIKVYKNVSGPYMCCEICRHHKGCEFFQININEQLCRLYKNVTIIEAEPDDGYFFGSGLYGEGNLGRPCLSNDKCNSGYMCDKYQNPNICITTPYIKVIENIGVQLIPGWIMVYYELHVNSPYTCAKLCSKHNDCEFFGFSLDGDKQVCYMYKDMMLGPSVMTVYGAFYGFRPSDY